jgi:hypothetical protein
LDAVKVEDVVRALDSHADAGGGARGGPVNSAVASLLEVDTRSLSEVAKSVLSCSSSSSRGGAARRSAVFAAVIGMMNRGCLTTRVAGNCLSVLVGAVDGLAPSDVPKLVQLSMESCVASERECPTIRDGPVDGVALDLLPKLLSVVPPDGTVSAAGSVVAGALRCTRCSCCFHCARGHALALPPCVCLCGVRDF